jgi:dihydrofolate reductase
MPTSSHPCAALPRVAIIAALGSDGVLGNRGALIWRLPADLAHFKRVTLGHPILMGRKTWESIGRALPGRRNIVISRQPAYVASGAEVCASLPEALRLCVEAPDVFVVGGAEIYREALPLARQLWLTEVHASAPGDAYFPAWERADYTEVSRDRHAAEGDAPAFDCVLYARRG